MLMQDRCLVCAERAIGAEMVLDALDGLLHDVGQVQAHLGLFGDIVNLNAR
jgi:hypothetical protein